MLEPHSGSPFRRKGPFRDDVPDLEGGATHLHLNRRKGSLRVDLRTAAGRRLFETRLNEAKVLIFDVDRRRWRKHGLDPDAIRATHPDLHVCSITPYGIEGPKANWLGSELTLYAAGGYLRIGGEPDREPVKAWGEQGHLQAGLHAALGIVSALYADSRGQQIDTAVYEALAFLLGGGYQHAWFSDSEPMRNGARLVGFGPGHLYPSDNPALRRRLGARALQQSLSRGHGGALRSATARRTRPTGDSDGSCRRGRRADGPGVDEDATARGREAGARAPHSLHRSVSPIGSHGRRRWSPCIARLLADHRASSRRAVSGVGSSSEVQQLEVDRWQDAASGPRQRAAGLRPGSGSLEARRCCLKLGWRPIPTQPVVH